MEDKEIYSKTVENRTSRTLGHMAAIKRMMDEGRNYYDVLIQLAAVKAEIEGINKLIIKERLESDIQKAVDTNDKAVNDTLVSSIDKIL